MFMIWSLIFFLGKIFYRILRKNRMFIVRTWDLRNWIYNNKKSISIFLLGFLFIWIYWSFFLSIRGSETIYLDIDIRSDYYTELRCEDIVYEHYDETDSFNGYIEFRVHLEIKEKNKEGYEIRFYVKRNREYFYESFEKSYIEEWFTSETPFSEEINPSRFGYDAGNNYYYYFDISIPPKYDKVNFLLWLYVGKDLLPLDKEKIRLDRTIYTEFTKDTRVISDFGNSWNVTYDSFSREEKFIETTRDVHKLTSKIKEDGEKTLTQSIDLERNYTRRALRESRWGIFLSMLLAGISLIISISLHEKRSLDQRHKKRENN